MGPGPSVDLKHKYLGSRNHDTHPLSLQAQIRCPDNALVHLTGLIKDLVHLLQTMDNVDTAIPEFKSPIQMKPRCSLHNEMKPLF